MNTLDQAKELLHTNDFWFLALKGDIVIAEKEYRPGALLAQVHNDKHCLSGAVVAANAIGRAEALLLTYGGIMKIHAKVMTVPAVRVFRNRSIEVHYDQLLDNIPEDKYPISADLEKKCMDILSPFEAFELLEQIFPQPEDTDE